MRAVSDLVASDDTWPRILELVAEAPYPVEVLPVAEERAASCLAQLEVSTASWLGAVTYHSGGLLIDHGWLRVFGSGHAGRGLMDVCAATEGYGNAVMVAQDVLGGRFAWVQPTPRDQPTVHYYGPDELSWQDLGSGYGDWLHWMLTGATERFYQDLRWPGWAAEVAACPVDHGIHTWPPPWSAEGKDVGAASRQAVPMAQLIGFHEESAARFEAG
jgi:hypothetical protein